MKVTAIGKLDTQNKSKSNKEQKDANKSFRDLLAALKNKGK